MKKCSQFCITWKLLNMPKAKNNICFSIFLVVRGFDCSPYKLSKRSKNEIETRDLWLIVDRFWDLKPSKNRLKTKLESNATKKQPERPRKRQWQALRRRESGGSHVGKGLRGRVNPSQRVHRTLLAAKPPQPRGLVGFLL